jgi:hypothetical protein
MTFALLVILATANLFTAKQHVDNPGQTPMQSATAQDHVENPSNTPMK